MAEIKQNNFKFDMSKIKKQDTKKINKIILHHRAGNGDIKSIHRQHIKRGWAGIGYHYYIRKSGVVFAGRPVTFVGSHCPGNNTNSIGICLEGDFTKEVPTLEQLKSLKDLVISLRYEYPSITRVFNHRDLHKTLCPATDLVRLVQEDY